MAKHPIRWRVDLIRKVLATLGTVEAPDEKSAIATAAEEFSIPPERRNATVALA
jgi:1,2-phenylacetyl-CoA epoxidase PaaB subunit